MATAIEKYNAAKADHGECAGWANLIGSAYHGGVGRIGTLHSIRIASGEAAPTIYHQHSDGAKNYHAMPESLRPHLEAAIKRRIVELLADALSRQKAELRAALAVKEHAEMMAAAGITTP